MRSRRSFSDGNDLQRDHVRRATVLRLAQIVGQAQVLAAGLPREIEARDLPAGIVGRVYHDVVAVTRTAGK